MHAVDFWPLAPPSERCRPPPRPPSCSDGTAKVGDVGMAKVMAGDYVSGVLGTLAWWVLLGGGGGTGVRGHTLS